MSKELELPLAVSDIQTIWSKYFLQIIFRKVTQAAFNATDDADPVTCHFRRDVQSVINQSVILQWPVSYDM